MKVKHLFKLAAQLKVYFQSATFYLSFVNFVLILATFKVTYDIDISAFVIVPLGFICILLLGFLDYKLILSHQSKYINEKNSLKSQLNRIEEKLEKLEGKLK